MALQGRFLRMCNVLGNYNKNLLGNASWNNLPIVQQIAGKHTKTLEEKLNLPARPKRPLTPYFKFMAQIRPEIKQSKPDLNVTEIVREITARWEKIDPQYKSNLEAEYHREHEVYSKERLKYDTNLTDEQKNMLKQAKIDRSEKKGKRQLKQKSRENNKPRKPCSGFVLYMKSRLPSRGSIEFRTFQKQVAADWANLPESEKAPFIHEVDEQMREYKKTMVEWERKMIKMGNTDIVRQDALIEPKLKLKGNKPE